jgi:hypothetical protein
MIGQVGYLPLQAACQEKPARAQICLKSPAPLEVALARLRLRVSFDASEAL